MTQIEPTQPTLRTAVLLVEDEMMVRMNEAQILEDAGYQVLEADAGEALRILEKRADEVAVLYTDIRMPGSQDGLALARLAYERWPHLHLLVTSGHARLVDTELPDDGRFLPKPHRPETLVQMVQEVIHDSH